MWASTLYSAYFALGIDNGASLADEDVAVRYYKCGPVESGHRLREALEFIAEARRSRFLRFMATIGQHLNENNVAVLAKTTFGASPEPESAGPESVGGRSGSAESAGEGPAGGEGSQDLVSESSGSEMEMDAFGEYYATGEDSPSQLRSPSSSEVPTSSGSSGTGTSADSDFSEEVGGIFFDRDNINWRCEECDAVLVNWKCPDGHRLRRCKKCGWQLDNGPCQRCPSICGACGGESVDGQCSSCEAVEESEGEDTIAFDERDGLWRCTDCQWEVEADNETNGNCHCLNDKGEAHFIDLSDCLDYEPADSCSSADDSTDEESNSDDEGFIDNSEIPIDGLVPGPAIDAVSLAALYSKADVARIMKAQEIANGSKMAKDKENVEPTASSDDIEIIDAPTANWPPKLPSNIIDCESMDI